MDRLRIAKQEEQEAFLAVFREILLRYNVLLDLRSCSQAMKVLRASIRKESSSLNGALSRAVFTGTRLFPLLEKAVSSFDLPDHTKDLFDKARHAAIARGAIDSGRSIGYFMRHPRMFWSAFLSSWIGQKLCGMVFPFDPKGFAKNISGSFFLEIFEGGTTILWTMGPTPTLGNILAPEMERALESLERKEKWVYVNLQSLGSKNERLRSLAFLDAAKRHPDKFFAASISVDSPLYKGLEGTDIEDHKKRLILQLSRAVFLNESTWYFFSLRREEKEKWWSIVEEVIDRAFFIAQDNISVFHELVVLGLIRAWQAFHVEKGKKLISTIACKECIDRGGSVNAAFLWALLGDHVEEKERAVKTMAVLWGRPLLAKRRLIEKSRTKGFKALSETFCPHEIHAYLDGIWHQAATLAASSHLVL